MEYTTHISQTSEYVQSKVPVGTISFRLGQPDPNLLPRDVITEMLGKRLKEAGGVELLQYGNMLGYMSCREEIGKLNGVSSEWVRVTGGISQAIFLAATVLTSSLSHPFSVVLEDPTYFLAGNIFKDVGARLESVPVDEDGMSVDTLESLLRDGVAFKDAPLAIVYTIPTFQNPTGVSLSEKRAKKLFALAKEFGFTVFSDEPYNLLSFEDKDVCEEEDSPYPPQSVLGRTLSLREDSFGMCLSFGTFSKLMAPALRVGWVIGVPSLVSKMDTLGMIRSGGCPNPLMSSVAHEAIQSGWLIKHVRMLRTVLRHRRDVLSDAMQTHIPDALFSVPKGGYFLWVDLSRVLKVPVHVLVEHAITMNLILLEGSACSVSSHSSRLLNYVRLCFAFHDEDDLVEGVKRLKRAIENVNAL